MDSINQVMITGRVGQPPCAVTGRAGEELVRFTLATRRVKRPGEGPAPELDWHTVVALGELGRALMERVQRGDQVSVVGELRHDRWQDRDGSPRRSTTILATHVALTAPARSSLAAYPHVTA